ncbi:Alkylated DNA repair protein alkB 8 [Asimina triloba]
MEMESTISKRRWRKEQDQEQEQESPNLYVANCGPAVGLSFHAISSVFGRFGEIIGVFPADDTGARVIVSYSQPSSASSALAALDGFPCPLLGARTLHIRYSFALQPPPPKPKAVNSVAVSVAASDLGIPGLYLVRDFITPLEEHALLAAVDERPWKCLSKRRVQHYGYEFLYQTRNVDAKQFLGELPSFVSPVLEKISVFPNSGSTILDQLTVNEYPPGVGLAPHIDTHSAFDEPIFSLSLAGPCIMELRMYPHGKCLHTPSQNIDVKEESSDKCSDFTRKAIFLPPRGKCNQEEFKEGILDISQGGLASLCIFGCFLEYDEV